MPCRLHGIPAPIPRPLVVRSTPTSTPASAQWDAAASGRRIRRRRHRLRAGSRCGGRWRQGLRAGGIVGLRRRGAWLLRVRLLVRLRLLLLGPSISGSEFAFVSDGFFVVGILAFALAWPVALLLEDDWTAALVVPHTANGVDAVLRLFFAHCVDVAGFREYVFAPLWCELWRSSLPTRR